MISDETRQVAIQALEAIRKGYQLFDTDNANQYVQRIDAALAELRQPNAPDADVREALAEYAHEAWSGWMKYLFGKGERRGQFSADPTKYSEIEVVWIMPAWAVERWTRQMNTSYADLPESEKESDRQEADRMLAIVQPAPDAWKVAEQMRAIRGLEPETRHEKGDELMCNLLKQLGYGEAINEFESWTKWYA